MPVTDYASAEAFLVNEHTKRAVPRKKIANHTYVERGGHVTGRGDQIGEGEIGVVLHETAVVVYGPDYLRLNTGGWYTMVTTERIERFTPREIRIFSDANSRWRVMYGLIVEGEPYWDRPSVPFYDGITFLHASRFPGARKGDYHLPETGPVDTSNEDAHNAMVKRLVRRYLKRLRDHGSIGDPGLTRTWSACALCMWADMPTMTGPYCSTAIIPNIGDRMEDQQHLLDHMLDGVLPNELELHAIRERAGDLERAEVWFQHGIRTEECLRKFLLTRLLVGAVTVKHGRRPVVIPTEPIPAIATIRIDPF